MKRAAPIKTPSRVSLESCSEPIGYATQRTAFGWVVVGATQKGLCWLALDDTSNQAIEGLRVQFPLAPMKRDASLSQWIDTALAQIHGQRPPGKVSEASSVSSKKSAIRFDVGGTEFQRQVWQALRTIPRGETRSYGQLALEIGNPQAIRAVARACGANRIALLVPCHRVIGSNGSLTGYHWGLERKRQLLDAESKNI